jgi:hypothetical protein
MPAKGSKVEDPVILERLAKAREKAIEVRRMHAEEKKKIKLVAEVEHQAKVKDATEKLVVYAAPKKELKVKVEVESESSSDEEEEVVIVKKKKSPPPQQQPPQPIQRQQPPQRPQLTPQQRQYLKTYRSLFG